MYPGASTASPLNSLSTPAMIRSSELLPDAVEAQHADLGPVEIGERDILQHHLAVWYDLLTRIIE